MTVGKSDDIEELKSLIAANLDVTEILDIIGYDTSDLVNLLEEEIEDHHQEFVRACN
jgi:hypothetical protein